MSSLDRAVVGGSAQLWLQSSCSMLGQRSSSSLTPLQVEFSSDSMASKTVSAKPVPAALDDKPNRSFASDHPLAVIPAASLVAPVRGPTGSEGASWLCRGGYVGLTTTSRQVPS